MSCRNRLDNDQPCGDEGQLCDSCFRAEMQSYSWLQHVSKYAAGAPIDEDYDRELIDAGRGHLVLR